MPKKSAYFQPENRIQQAQKMLRSVGRIHAFRQIPFYPSQAALLLLDLQEVFLNPASHAFLPAAQAIFPALMELAKVFDRIQQPILFTQHLNTLENAAMMSRWWRELITPVHPLRGLDPSFLPFARLVITKTQYDAFYQTPLEDHLRQLEITQVVIGGVMTHLCCETTARSAFQRGFETFFLVDGTATYNEMYHQATLLNLTQGFAVPIFCHEVIAACSICQEQPQPWCTAR